MILFLKWFCFFSEALLTLVQINTNAAVVSMSGSTAQRVTTAVLKAMEVLI